MDRRTRTLVDAWLGTCQSPNTRDAYARDLNGFAHWCEQTHRTPLGTQPEDLDAYRDQALAAGSSAATVARRLSAIASFFRHAEASGSLDANPADGVNRPDHTVASPEPLDADELACLLDAADALGPKAAALVGLLALEGMKLGEVLAIDIPSVTVSGRRVSIEVSRRGSQQRITVSPRSATAIRAYLGDRRRGPLFTSDGPSATQRQRLSRFGADFIVKRTKNRAAIDKPVTASILRRTYITTRHRAGAPLADIAQHIGHRTTRDTARLLETPE